MKKQLTFVLFALLFTPLFSNGEIVVKNGDKIAFLGDSITFLGASSPAGYCNLVVSALDENGVTVETVFAGISGHKSDQMLDRLESDILVHKPEWMFLSCGVNDVWHGEKGVSLPEYKKNISKIVETAQAAGIKVILLTSTLIGEDSTNDNNRKLDEYNEFLHSFAAEKSCRIAELNNAMKRELEAKKSAGAIPGTLLTVDGVHMNPVGNMMMAEEVLKSIDFSAEEIAKAKNRWLEIPGAWNIRANTTVTIDQYLRLDRLAAEKNISVQEFLNRMIADTINNIR